MFHEAAKRGNIETIKRCLEYKVFFYPNEVPINCLDASSSTALHWAAAFGQEVMVWKLMHEYLFYFLQLNKIGDTPLHNATWKNYANIVKILVEAGADPTITNNEGKIPLGLAVQAESKAILKKRMCNFSPLIFLKLSYQMTNISLKATKKKMMIVTKLIVAVRSYIIFFSLFT
ncbi:hypothetical protein MXB_1523 [Myxobolus squamalis]|nr:hypothetical protein MXB_1523 [Myxobolus squamalis]